jgi:hypothetical protein
MFSISDETHKFSTPGTSTWRKSIKSFTRAAGAPQRPTDDPNPMSRHAASHPRSACNCFTAFRDAFLSALSRQAGRSLHRGCLRAILDVKV